MHGELASGFVVTQPESPCEVVCSVPILTLSALKKMEL